MCLLLCSEILEYDHWCIYFYKLRDPTPWNFGENIEGSALLLKVSIWLFCPKYLVGDPNLFEELDGTFILPWYINPIPILPEVSALVARRLFLWPWCSWCSIMGFFSSIGSFMKCNPNVLEGRLRNSERCVGKSSTWLLVSPPLEQEGIVGLSYLFSDGIIFTIFTIVLYDKERLI